MSASPETRRSSRLKNRLPALPIFLVAVLLGLEAWAGPVEVSILQAAEVPLMANGRQIGSMKLPAGTKLKIVSVVEDGVMVTRGGVPPFKISKDAISPESLALAQATPQPAAVPTKSPLPSPPPQSAPPPPAASSPEPRAQDLLKPG